MRSRLSCRRPFEAGTFTGAVLVIASPDMGVRVRAQRGLHGQLIRRDWKASGAPAKSCHTLILGFGRFVAHTLNAAGFATSSSVLSQLFWRCGLREFAGVEDASRAGVAVGAASEPAVTGSGGPSAPRSQTCRRLGAVGCGELLREWRTPRGQVWQSGLRPSLQ